MQFYTIGGFGRARVASLTVLLKKNVQLNIDFLPLVFSRTTYLGHQ